MKMQQKSQRGRMPVTLSRRRAASNLLSIKEVIWGSKQQWKIVVLMSTLCQVLSEMERVSAPTKQMEIILLHQDKAGLPPGSWLHKLSLSTTPHAKQLSGRRFDTAAIFTIAPYFFCPEMQTQRQLFPWKNKRLPLINRMLGILRSHTHTCSLYYCVNILNSLADPFTHCTHNASSSCYIHHWAPVGAVGVSLRVFLLAGYINNSLSHLWPCSRKAQRQIDESKH